MRTTFVLVCLCLASHLFAQGIPSDGRDFYLGYVPPYFPLGSKSATHVVTLNAVSTIACTVSVSYVSSTGEDIEGRDFQLVANIATSIPIDAMKLISDGNGEIPENKTIHVVSTAPITLTLNSAGPCRGGSYLALPIECLGRHYVVMTYNDNPAGIGGYDFFDKSVGEACIVAAYDATEVTITPTVQTAGGKSGVSNGVGSPFKVTLSRGQSYFFKSLGLESTSDLSGTIIDATRPVAVFSGHSNAITQASAFPSPDAVEARNSLLQQLPPVECFDTTGYYTIPWFEAGGGGDGAGDEVRTYTAAIGGSNVTLQSPQPFDLSTNPLNLQTPSLPSVQVPTFAASTNGRPFAMAIYDQRRQAASGPYPSPNMCWVVPQRHWKTEYLCSPASSSDDQFTNPSYFLSLICRQQDWSGGILVSVDGSNPVGITHAGLSIKKTWSAIPGNAGMMGAEIAAYYGHTYRIYNTRRVDSTHPEPAPFGILENRMHAYDPERDAIDANTYFFSGANPAGMSYSEYGLSASTIRDSVTYTCGKWTVCLHDSSGVGNGIRYVEILNYVNNDLLPQPRLAKNLRLSPSVDPYSTGAVAFDGLATSLCVDIEPIVPTDSAYGTLAVYDNSGAVHLVTLSARPTFEIVAAAPMTKPSAGQFDLGATRVDSGACGSITIKNPDVDGARDLVIDSLYLVGDTAHFHIEGQTNAFPLTVLRGANRQFTVCFAPDDTTSYIATLRLVDHCGNRFAYTITGFGESGLLQAADITLDQRVLGDSACAPLTLRNVGTRPLQLVPVPVISDTADFSIDPAFLGLLPLTLLPGDSVSPLVCFHPRSDSTRTGRIEWHTNIPSSLERRMKSVSVITGLGYDPRVSWDPGESVFLGDSTAAVINIARRVTLRNDGRRSVLVHSIVEGGADSADFSISDNELGLLVLSEFHLQAADSIWVELRFRPEATTGVPDGFRDRHATLVANVEAEGVRSFGTQARATLRGTFSPDAFVAATGTDVHLRCLVYPDRLEVLGVPLGATAQLYDVLGRRIAVSAPQTEGEASVRILRDGLPSGSYVLKAGEKTVKVMLVR